MKRLPLIYFLIAFSLLFNNYMYSQITTNQVEIPVSYHDYMELVINNNLGYAAEKFNVDIAKANIRSAHSFPDPELSFEATDNGERQKEMGYEFEASLDWLLELGGKRKARIELATSEGEVSMSLLEDYYRNLRAEATLLFLQALRNEHIYETHKEAYQNMLKIARADSIRHSLGEIAEVTARQSKLEARTIYNSMLDAEDEWKSSLLDLDFLINSTPNDTIIKPIGSFTRLNREFMLPNLIIAAQNNRSDFIAALQNREVSRRLVNLERANRKVDLGLSFKVGYATYVHNVIAPTPSHTPISLGVSIPLKFSNRHNSDLRIAKFQQQQVEYEYAQIENQIAVEVTQAYRHYNTMRKQLQQFDEGILTEAKIILEGRTYSYNRGENSLLEVLDAQRTYNEIQENYYETLYNTAAALVELEKSAGIWDIVF